MRARVRGDDSPTPLVHITRQQTVLAGAYLCRSLVDCLISPGLDPLRLCMINGPWWVKRFSVCDNKSKVGLER